VMLQCFLPSMHRVTHRICGKSLAVRETLICH